MRTCRYASARHLAVCPRRPFYTRLRRYSKEAHEDGASVIPTTPTWSVHELLSSYPKPSITPTTFKRLHELAALPMPSEDSSEYTKLKIELEEMVRLVEAVRLVDVEAAEAELGIRLQEDGESVPDGRIWPSGVGMELSPNIRAEEEEGEPQGRDLLQHAAKTENGFYVVEREINRSKS